METSYLYGTIVTGLATSANNRGDDIGNNSPLQKTFYNDMVHTTVSAESIRFALRYRFQLEKLKVNRSYDVTTGQISWVDESHDSWNRGTYFIDDDLMGFMNAQAAKEEAPLKTPHKAPKAMPRNQVTPELSAKGKVNRRTSPFQMGQATSLRPFFGESSFNCVSGQKRSDKPTIYTSELHTTEYQYTFSLGMVDVMDKSSIAHLLDAIVDPPTVAGNHARHYYDFSPRAIVLRATNDYSSRILDCFHFDKDTRTVSMAELIQQIAAGDVSASEIVFGGKMADTAEGARLKELGATVFTGTKDAVAEMKKRILPDGSVSKKSRK